MNDHPSGYEHRDTNIRRIFLTALAGVVFIVVVVIVLYNAFINTREEIYFEQTLKPVAPELPALRHAEDSTLNSYGVIDSAAGVYRVPIRHAMELIAADSTGTTLSK